MNRPGTRDQRRGIPRRPTGRRAARRPPSPLQRDVRDPITGHRGMARGAQSTGTSLGGADCPETSSRPALPPVERLPAPSAGPQASLGVWPGSAALAPTRGGLPRSAGGQLRSAMDEAWGAPTKSAQFLRPCAALGCQPLIAKTLHRANLTPAQRCSRCNILARCAGSIPTRFTEGRAQGPAPVAGNRNKLFWMVCRAASARCTCEMN